MAGDTPDGPIKSNAHRRSADKSEKSRARLTVQIDHQIVLRAADLLKQIKKRQHRMPSAAALREIAKRKKNDIRECRMTPHNLRVLRRDQPVDPRSWITRAQLHHHRQRMDDVAQARKFD